MKSDTQSKGLRLVDAGGAEAAETQPAPVDCTVDGLFRNKWLFVGACVACTVGAVAAGSYAAWLTKKCEAESVILDVHDLIKSCEDRVAQMEAQISRIGNPSD